MGGDVAELGGVGCVSGVTCAWKWGGRVEVFHPARWPQVTGRRKLLFPLQPEKQMYGPGRCIARDVQSSPPPACEIAFAGSNSIGLAFARGIFDQEGRYIWLEEGNCFFFPCLFFFFLTLGLFACLIIYLRSPCNHFLTVKLGNMVVRLMITVCHEPESSPFLFPSLRRLLRADALYC